MKAALALLAAAVALMAGCGGSTPAVTPPSPAAASPSMVPEAPVAVEPTQPTQPDVTEAATDRRYATCKEARSHGLGPYTRGTDPEYDWYRDADGDGIVCESTR